MPDRPLVDEYPNWVDDTSLLDQSPHMNIHLFGAYRGKCQDILEDIATYLRGNGYPGARICSNIPDHEVPVGITEEEFNWWESVYCMQNAQAAVFILLEPTEDRLHGAPKEGLNSSVFAELAYWTHFFSEKKIGTHVVFEGKMSNRGSLISGLINMSNTTEIEIESDQIEHIKEDILTTCLEWKHKSR